MAATNPDRPVYWRRYCVAPDTISRPTDRLSGAFFFFFASNYNDSAVNDIERLWPIIEQMTQEGQLGYYSGLSDDGEVIAVHYSDAEDSVAKEKIRQTLEELGVLDIKWKTQREVRDLKSEEEEDISEDKERTLLKVLADVGNGQTSGHE